MDDEPYQHRSHDHLVEPLFGGLRHAHDASMSRSGPWRRVLWIALAAGALGSAWFFVV